MTHNGREVEIKLAVSGADEARRMLRAAGFRVFKRRVFEKNTVFDTSSQTLRKSARLLRVRETGKIAKQGDRSQEPEVRSKPAPVRRGCATISGAVLTYKGPPDGGKHKSREELELELSDAHTIGAIFDRLAYHPAFRYEKFRTEFRQSGFSRVATGRVATCGVAMVDETPIGVYLELEGSPAWIDHTACQLGFSEKDYITASYARLYMEWCEARCVEPGDMLFA